ncbi:ABC transporter ATP-binding protein [Segnochrobactrum spirostomi]|uniref:ATP-binding cassette domain-containing protein n=1 Tax=Segnochrobactrum spirostomi TaxID=2608987 RepID=A0A6A7YBP3_9HYPH|nr:ATP-binding cassette domain-containing protein [Segnochrobactrum spirostomi]MQT15082.1 ATP-binding cassette domain-containing protein [Segnochrobactrum spirostomi]
MVASTRSPEPHLAAETAPAAFQAERLTFSIDGRVLLHPLDLAVGPGRMIALIGHNGSGKSTLLKMLARQETPSGGRVLFGGRQTEAWATREFARAVAYLPQNPPEAIGLTVRELVMFGRYPWHGPLGRVTETDRAKVAEALDVTGMVVLADRLVETLSGGERQRAWLAVLIAQDTRYLLLDEPISALDISHQIEVLDLVRRLSRERGLGVLAVLHDINMAARFCDEIVALKGGRLVARGSPDEVVEAGTLAEIYGVAMDVLRPSPEAPPIAFVR